MSTNSEYRVLALRGLPPGLLGTQSFAVATATELRPGKFLAEYFVLTKRPTETVKSGAMTLDFASLPPDLGRFDLETTIDEARSQIEIETVLLLEKQATQANRPDLAYQAFTYTAGAASILSAWMHGNFIEQIKFIKETTRCSKLQVYLGFVLQNTLGDWAPRG